MEKVYYHGKAYLAKPFEANTEDKYLLLYSDGVLTHFVAKDEVERKAIWKTVIDFYCRGVEYALENRYN